MLGWKIKMKAFPLYSMVRSIHNNKLYLSDLLERWPLFLCTPSTLLCSISICHVLYGLLPNTLLETKWVHKIRWLDPNGSFSLRACGRRSPQHSKFRPVYSIGFPNEGTPQFISANRGSQLPGRKASPKLLGVLQRDLLFQSLAIQTFWFRHDKPFGT
jgi:hypothetical protein